VLGLMALYYDKCTTANALEVPDLKLLAKALVYLNEDLKQQAKSQKDQAA
jgi:hypothetical protein